MSVMSLFPFSRVAGEPPSVYGGVPARASREFRPSAQSGLAVCDFRPQVPVSSGGPTAVRVVLSVQPQLSMLVFSPGIGVVCDRYPGRYVAFIQGSTLRAERAGGQA
ncbi:hypothetical protein GCM10009006_37900 [Haloarcula argentinensis]|uniref:Uncharacterized protein n=1 Tax=Haloarcula argentinensis TaxID=43776 RepID=A0A830FJJ3_HALAR|nr:hypothetical protein GCM10009006_37900 [Haloarcula argentinensis]